MKILDNLYNVKKVGSNRWQACCPAHDDKSPSLAITEKDDRILIKCWAGCSTQSILNALGLDWSDLFFKPLSDAEKAARKEKYQHEQRERDRMFLALCASARSHGEKIHEEDLQLEREAWWRLRENNNR